MSYDNDGAAAPRVEFGPCPEAVPVEPVDMGARDPRALSAGGLCYWKSQAFCDLTGPEPVHTSRTVMQVTGQDGLQAAARFTTTFNPRYERLVVHAIRVHRAGSVRDACRPEAFELIRRELNLERAVYDGFMTAHAVIPDVREGDVVETLYSVIGANPALQGWFGWWFTLQWSIPVVETRCTLRLPAERRIAVRPLGREVRPRDATADGVRTLDWVALDLPPEAGEPHAPAHIVPFAAVHVTDEGSWSQAAEVFRPWYAPPESLPADLEAVAAEIATAAASPADRTARALRMVQGALRYHSVSIGDGGYRPRTVEQIWATRYGDCKDASLLTVALLRRLGLDAVCALVNTGQGDDLPQALPNAQAFNHCIVRVRLDGKSVWLDPTMPTQAGDLAHLTQARFGHALPLVAGAALEPMPDWPMVTACETVEVWTLPRHADERADLELTNVYRRWRADGLRNWIANQGAEKVDRELREGLERELKSGLKTLEPVRIEDDTAANVLTITERYQVAQPYQALPGTGRPGFLSRDDVVGPHLPDLGPDRRRFPLQLGAPRRVATERVFNLPGEQAITPWEERLEGPCGLVLETSFAWAGKRRGVQKIALTIPQGELPPEEQDRYRTFLASARAMNGISFPAPAEAGRGARHEESGVPWNWIIWIAVVGGIGLARLLAG